MSDTIESIFERIKKLPTLDRIRLANEIIDNLTDEEHESAWADELERRFKEVENGAPTYDADDVMVEARARAVARR